MPQSLLLTRGLSTIVDDDDFDAVSRHKWSAFRSGKTFYAARKVRDPDGQRVIFLHREINRTPPGLMTDHINGDTLDNRKANLRNATSSQNQMNRKTLRKGARLKGAWFDPSSKQAKQWRSSIEVRGRKKYLGRYHTEQEAADAYAAAAREMQGDFVHHSIGDEK